MYYAHQYYLDQVRSNPTMASFLAQKTQRRLDLANERARDEKNIPNNDEIMAPAATTRPPNLSTAPTNPNRRDRTNWLRRSNGGRPNDRRYRNRNTRFGRNGGTYVTIASEYGEATNRQHGYHGDARGERSNLGEGHDEAPEPEWTRYDGDSSKSENE